MAEVLKSSKPVSMCTRKQPSSQAAKQPSSQAAKQPSSHISCLLKSMPAPFIRICIHAISSSGDMLDRPAFTPKGKASTSGQPAQNAHAQRIGCIGINSNADNRRCASHISTAGLIRGVLKVESQLQPRRSSGVSLHHVA